jgi:hypothetical protein
MKHLLLGALLMTGWQLSAQTNLIENWDGNGDINQATSYPSTYGWEVTAGTFNYANSTGGVRYNDVTTGHTLNGSNYTGRLLMVRWDGAGSTSLASVYSYPVLLEANKKYKFSFIYEWWDNATVPTYTVGIGPDKAGTNLAASKNFACSPTKRLLQQGELEFFNTTAGTQYLTIKANNLAALGGIGELSIIEVQPKLESDASAVALNYYESAKTITINPNGSNNPITIAAPTGIKLSTNALPFSGGKVTVSSTDSSTVAGQLAIAQGTDVLNIPITASFPEGFLNLAKIDTLTVDGAWCWFADPRAIYHKGITEQTYSSWITRDGDIVIASYNHETGQYIQKTLVKGLQKDDHANPSIFIRTDGRIILFYSKHFDTVMRRMITTNPEDISSWGTEYTFGSNVTYPYPFQVGSDIVVFYRGDTDWHPMISVSKDNGETFLPQQKFIVGGGQRPYTRFSQDNTGAIHMAFTTGHPRNEPSNKIYYACYKNGAFYRANGTLIKNYTGTTTALNIDLNEAETVYNATAGKGWIWDLTVDENLRPVMVYASFPTDTDHRYHYARWTGSQWFQKEITKAGKWFPQTPAGVTEPEPNYSGGIIMDYNNPSVVYLSKPVKGVFEIFKYTTPDQGVTWDTTAITWNTPAHLLNVRPIVPRHHKPGYFDVIWMRGTYRYYTDYNTALVFSAPAATETLTSIAFDVESMELKKSNSQQLNVSYVPFLTTNKSLQWSSSDESVAIVVNGLVTAISPGNATITATAHNGVKATCLVHVSEPNYLTNALFDFGTATSPVAAGALQVTETTMINDSYGWTTTVLSRDRGSAASDELRDFNMASAGSTFKVFVKPGTYSITAKQGDFSFAHDNMNIYVNGVVKASNVNSAINTYITSTFDVTTVTDVLEFTFTDGGGADANWVINSLKIEAQLITSTPKNNIPLGSQLGLMKVYDNYGRLAFTENLNGNHYIAVLGQHRLPKGLYLVTLELGNQTNTIKHLVK